MRVDIEKLLGRLSDLTTGITDPAPYSQLFAEVAAKIPAIGTPRLHAILAVDREVVAQTQATLLRAFSELEATVATDNKSRDLRPLEQAVLERFDLAAAASLEVRDKALDGVATRLGLSRSVIAKDGADRATARRELAAQIDGLLGKSDAISERDRRVQRRAFRTSLMVSGAGVLLSCLIAFFSQSLRQTDDRRFQLREELRKQLQPRLTRWAIAAAQVSSNGGTWGNYEDAVWPLDTSIATRDQLRIAYGPGFATTYDSLARQSKSLVTKLDSAFAWPIIQASAPEIRRLLNSTVGFDR